MNPMLMQHMRGWGWGGHMWILGIVCIVFIVVIVLVVVNALQSKKEEGETESPMDVLKKRYARGEIDDEEFERKKERLEKE